uniref:Borealin N-terminal domain-containing protein n=1 Tax=Cyclopterus lumpus TaxID=8103 RepID=A0A8C2Z6H3_CYCLU
MMARRTRHAGKAQSKEQLSRDMRQSRLALFIQQFEKEAQERMNELEARMDNMLATVDKVFKVELMKMPPSLQKTRIGDLISGEWVKSVLFLHQNCLYDNMVVHGHACRVYFITPSVLLEEEISSSEVFACGKLVCNIRLFFYSGSVTAKRTRSCLIKTNDQTAKANLKLRSVPALLRSETWCRAACDYKYISFN